MQANIWPFFIILKTGISIDTTNSDFITSSKSDIFAPFSSYSESEYPEFSPAPFSITISKPSFANLGIERGTSETRVSFSFFSFGIPIRIIYTIKLHDD